MWISAVYACALLLAACGSHEHVVISSGSDAFTVSDGKVVLHGTGGSTAEIGADGVLAIDGKPVAVTDAQRATLLRYHATAMQFIDHAKETGVAGAEVGVAAATEVVKGLASGDTSKIGERIEAKVGPVKAAAGKLCEDLATIAELQTALSTDLAAFKPFSVIGDNEPAKCRRDLDKGTGEKGTTTSAG
jgi:hypothetical protein